MNQIEFAIDKKNMIPTTITTMTVMMDIVPLTPVIVHQVTGMALQKLQHTPHLPHHMKLPHLHIVLHLTKHPLLRMVLLHMIRKRFFLSN